MSEVQSCRIDMDTGKDASTEGVPELATVGAAVENLASASAFCATLPDRQGVTSTANKNSDRVKYSRVENEGGWSGLGLGCESLLALSLANSTARSAALLRPKVCMQAGDGKICSCPENEFLDNLQLYPSPNGLTGVDWSSSN